MNRKTGELRPGRLERRWKRDCPLGEIEKPPGSPLQILRFGDGVFANFGPHAVATAASKLWRQGEAEKRARALGKPPPKRPRGAPSTDPRPLLAHYKRVISELRIAAAEIRRWEFAELNAARMHDELHSPEWKVGSARGRRRRSWSAAEAPRLDLGFGAACTVEESIRRSSASKSAKLEWAGRLLRGLACWRFAEGVVAAIQGDREIWKWAAFVAVAGARDKEAAVKVIRNAQRTNERQFRPMRQ